MAETSSILPALEPMYPFLGAAGNLVIGLTVIYTAVKMLGGNRIINWGSTFFQFGVGVFLIFAKPLLTFLVKFLSWAVGADARSAQETPAPQPAPAPSPSGSTDLSWIPAALTIAGVVAIVVATGLGVFHYYRKSIRPAREKARNAAYSAATLIAEARKTLEQVVLGSASYETDLAKQIDYPMMTDVTEPVVSKYIKEMRQAQEQERALAKKPLLEEAERFSNTVTCLKISYDNAVRQAERVRWSKFSVAEQRRLKDARVALDVIHDSSTTAEQRNAQYKRVAKLLDGLIVMTEPVRQSLSAWVPMLSLSAGSTVPAVALTEKEMASA